MMHLTCRPHDRLEFGATEIGSLESANGLPWVRSGVGRFFPTRLGMELRIGPHVGRIVIPDRVVIDIEEPFPGTVATCLELTAFGRKAAEQDSPASPLTASPWLAVAESYQDILAKYVSSGIERRYIPIEIVTSRPRGKIQVPHTAIRLLSRGRTDQVACVPRVMTDDTAFNRAVSAAAMRTEQILLREGGPKEPLRAIRSCLISLSGVRRDVIPDFTAAWQSLNIDQPGWRRLLSMAQIIVDGIPALPPGERQDSAYPMTAWLNVEKIFEDAIRSITLRASAGLGSVRAGENDGVELFTHSATDPATPQRAANPDIVVSHQNGTLLLDAKYRRHAKPYTDNELYQLMAHASAYRAEAAALVAPVRPGEVPGERWIGRDKNGTAYYVISVNPQSIRLMQAPIHSWLLRHLNPQGRPSLESEKPKRHQMIGPEVAVPRSQSSAPLPHGSQGRQSYPEIPATGRPHEV